MGIFDRFRRKKKAKLEALPSPAVGTDAGRGPVTPTSVATGNVKAQMDLVLAQVDSLRMQYETINARLQNIERLVTEIRSFCR